jgi:FAD/FMN-containing dehydrogenase
MATASVRTKKQSGVAIAVADLEQLRSSLRGKLLRSSDDGYDQARTVWNAMIDRKPGLIVQPVGVADVKAAVNFARDHDLLVAIKGGGHNIAGSAMCDDGLVIDFSSMRSVRIDPAAGIAHVEPGATLGDFDHEAQSFGLGTPLGINSTTGVAGLTLGGGFGWLTRQHGMTVDNLLAADVVTANGQLVSCSSSQNSDLFWALCGGGGNFGVVTRFEFKLHKVGPTVLSGLVVYPLSEAAAALKKYREYVKTLPHETNVWVVLRKAPPLPFLPVEAHGTDILAFAVFHNGNLDDGRKNLEPVRNFGKKLGEFVDGMPYTAWQKMFDPMLGPGARNYWKSHNIGILSDELIDVLVQQTGKLPSDECDLFLGFIQGEPGKKSKTATAYAHRETGWAMNVHGRWQTADQDEACIKWARELFRETAPYAMKGVYVNFLTAEEKERVKDAYGVSWDRLLEIKRKYDPENLFCMNQNIDPKG